MNRSGIMTAQMLAVFFLACGMFALTACSDPFSKGPGAHQTQEPLSGFLSTRTGLGKDFSWLSEARGFLIGQVSDLTEPQLDGSGVMTFDMDVLTFASTSATVTITIPADAQLLYSDEDGNVTEMSKDATLATLRNAPFLVQASGNGDVDVDVYLADVGLIVFAFPNDFEIDQFPSNYSVGAVYGPAGATLSRNGTLEFDMTEWNLSSAYGDDAGYTAMTHVVVLPAADIFSYDEDYNGSTMRREDAQALLNSDTYLSIEATSNIAVSDVGGVRTLTIDSELSFFEGEIDFGFSEDLSGVLFGEAVLTADGDVELTLEDRWGYSGPPGTHIQVEAPADAYFSITVLEPTADSYSYEYSVNDAAEFVAAIQTGRGGHIEIETVIGTFDQDLGVFVADEIDILMLSDGREWYTGYPSDEVVVNGNGDVTFTLEDWSWLEKGDAEVSLPAGLPIRMTVVDEFGEYGPPVTLSAQQFADAIRDGTIDMYSVNAVMAIGTLNLVDDTFAAEEIWVEVSER